MGDRLHALWDWNDLDVSERRFRELLGRETSNTGRAEVLTQLARVAGLRGRFDEGHRLLDQAEALAGSATPRTTLERGRLRRSSGEREAAFELFEASFAAAVAEHDEFLAADAAHMTALAAPTPDAMAAWTRRGIEVAEQSDDPYWLGPLLNNLGWAHYGAGDYAAALDAFERALAARERDSDRAYEAEIARYAVGKALRALRRTSEAVTMLEQAVAWTRRAGRPDGWFHEELAEEYADLGRADEARQHARLALSLLADADPSLEGDAARLDRLRELAAVGRDTI